MTTTNRVEVQFEFDGQTTPEEVFDEVKTVIGTIRLRVRDINGGEWSPWGPGEFYSSARQDNRGWEDE